MTLPLPVRDALDTVASGVSAGDLESGTLEFKTVVRRSQDDTFTMLAEASACFANAGGGQLVVGVRDRPGGPEAILGSPLETEQTQRRIYQLTEPSLVVTVEAVSYAGTSLTLVSVPRSPDIHQVRGRATERIGATCEPMSSVRIAAALADRRGDDWSALASTVRVEAASPRSVQEARQLLAGAPDGEHQSWANLRTPDLMRRLNLLGSDGNLNRAGELLLADGRAELIAYAHRRTRSGELTANERHTGPLLTALLTCLERIDLRMDSTPVNLPGGQQLFIPDLPTPAVREALVNAVVHRDYQSGRPVHVEHSATRLAVTSPGPFVPGVAPNNVLTVTPRSRNRILAVAMRHLGLAETAGVGVDRMYAEMVGVGHEPPRFTTDGFSVTATLLGGAPNAAVTRYVATLPVEHRRDPDPVLVLLALLTHRTVTAESLSPLLQKEVEEVESVLRSLSGPPTHMVERTRRTTALRFGTYRLRGDALAALGGAVPYNRRTPDDTDRTICDIVRETGMVTGRLVQSVLAASASTASRVLADLVDREILVKTSAAQRGPSVTYGPGPKFPRSARRVARSRAHGRAG